MPGATDDQSRRGHPQGLLRVLDRLALTPRLQEACLSACKLVLAEQLSDISKQRVDNAMVIRTLNHVLTVAISDPVDAIRWEILSSLPERLDPYLANVRRLPPHCHALTVPAQNDLLRQLLALPFAESFEIRELAVSLIGRLSIRNPAYINPTLRSLLIQILHSAPIADSPLEEETLRILGQS